MGSLVSIIIPCWNARETIVETLTSAIRQTYPHLEIIVVDDNSEDDTRKVVESLAHNQIRLLQSRGNGASAARNSGINAASGKFIQFLDADDLLAEDKIEHQVTLLERTDGTLASGVWGRFHNAVADTKFNTNPLFGLSDPIEWVCCNLQQSAMMHPAAWLVRRDLIDSAGLWDESLTLNDDGEFFIRMVLASGGPIHCSTARSYYRSGKAHSLSARKSETALYSRLRSLHLSMTFLFAAEKSRRTERAVADSFQRFVFESYPYARTLSRSAAEEVARLGGSQIQPDGGPQFLFWRKMLGWKLATRLRAARQGGIW